MCLAVPARVVELREHEVKVDLLGNRLWARSDLVPGLSVGDYVLLHAGIVLAQVDEESAQETFALLEEMARAQDDE